MHGDGSVICLLDLQLNRAVFELAGTTVVVGPAQHAQVDGHGHITIAIGQEQ